MDDSVSSPLLASIELFIEQTVDLSLDALFAIALVLVAPKRDSRDQTTLHRADAALLAENGGLEGALPERTSRSEGASQSSSLLLLHAAQPYSKFVLLTSLHLTCCEESLRHCADREANRASETNDVAANVAQKLERFFTEDERRRGVMRRVIIELLVRRGDISDESAEEASLADSAMATPDRTYVVDASVFPALVRVMPALESIPIASKKGNSSDASREQVLCCRHMWMRETVPLLALSMTLEAVALVARRSAQLRAAFRRWSASTKDRANQQEEKTVRIVSSNAVVSRLHKEEVPVKSTENSCAANLPPTNDATDCSRGALPVATPIVDCEHSPSPDQVQLVEKFFRRWAKLTDPFVRESMRVSEEYIAAMIEALRRRRCKIRLMRGKRLVLIRTAFELWRDVFIPQEKKLRLCGEQARRAMQRRVLKKWCESLQLRYSSRLSQDDVKRNVFDVMKRTFFRMKQLRASVRQVFASWRAACSLRMLTREKFVRRAFVVWKSAALLQRHSSLGTQENIYPRLGHARLLAQCFIRWKEKHLACRFSAKQVGRSFSKWVLLYETRCHNRLLCAEADRLRDRNRKLAALKTWRLLRATRASEASSSSSHVSLTTLARRHFMRQFWLVWVGRCCRRQEIASRLATTSALWDGRRLATNFCFWFQRLRLRSFGRMASATSRRRRLQLALHCWRARAQTSLHLHEWQEKQAVSFCDAALSRRVLRTWSDRWQQAEERLVIAAEQRQLFGADGIRNAALKSQCFLRWAGKYFANEALRRHHHLRWAQNPALRSNDSSSQFSFNNDSRDAQRVVSEEQMRRLLMSARRHPRALYPRDDGAIGLNQSSSIMDDEVGTRRLAASSSRKWAASEVYDVEDQTPVVVSRASTISERKSATAQRVVVHVRDGRLTPREVERKLVARLLLDPKNKQLRGDDEAAAAAASDNSAETSVEVVEILPDVGH